MNDIPSRAGQNTIEFGEDNVQQMYVLADQLRETHSGQLDDAAIGAISEACCLPPQFVRVALNRQQRERRPPFFQRFHSAFLALEPDDRRFVVSGTVASLAALCLVGDDVTKDQYGLFGTMSMILLGGGLWNVALCENPKVAALSGALFGGLLFIARSVFSMAFQSPEQWDSWLILPYVGIGAIGGMLFFAVASRFRARFGLLDPASERQDMLRQLVELQDKLREGEQSLTFLSLDIAGSTRMKELADPLSIEFTFTEYQNFVEMATRRFGGRVHSTAGDGVICAFEHPQQAFGAAKFILAGLVELNALRNKIGVPIRLRAGIHTGKVVAPPGQDVTKISFAHVIDVASHLQEASPVGGIAVSEPAARKLAGGPASVGETTIEVQGLVGHVWLPRGVALPESRQAALPQGPLEPMLPTSQPESVRVVANLGSSVPPPTPPINPTFDVEGA